MSIFRCPNFQKNGRHSFELSEKLSDIFRHSSELPEKMTIKTDWVKLPSKITVDKMSEVFFYGHTVRIFRQNFKTNVRHLTKLSEKLSDILLNF